MEWDNERREGRHQSNRETLTVTSPPTYLLLITNLGHTFHCLCHGSLGVHRLRTEDTHTHMSLHYGSEYPGLASYPGCVQEAWVQGCAEMLPAV